MRIGSASTNHSDHQGPPATASLTVFDDYVGTSSGVTNASVTALTSASFDDVLGFYDQLAIQVIVDDTTVGTAPAALTAQIAHSADGVNYVLKNAAPEVSTPTQLNIGAPTYMSFGFDGGTYPSLGFVRLVLTLTGAVGPVRARVRITVTGNNLNEQAFAQTTAKAIKAQAAEAKSYVLEYRAGQSVATATISELVHFINGLPHATDEQLHQQQKDAHDVLTLPSDHTQSEIADARAFILWEPILLRRNNGAFAGSSVVIPSGFMIAFLADGHYALIRGEAELWASKSASKALFPHGEIKNDSVGVGVTESTGGGKAGGSKPGGGKPGAGKPSSQSGGGSSGGTSGNDHSGPGYNTGGNPAHDVRLGHGKGK